MRGRVITNRRSENLIPKNWLSKSNIGILRVAHAQRKITVFARRPPLLEKDDATGNAAYKGPAAKDPKKMARKIPLKADFLPK